MFSRVTNLDRRNGRFVLMVSALAVIALALGACSPAATAPAPLPTVAAQPTQAAATAEPTAAPTAEPTAAPTAEPTAAPTEAAATAEPTAEQAAPTAEPSPEQQATTAAPAAGGSGAVSFANDVMPIFEERCIKCHGGERTRGGLDLKTYDSLMKGGEEGEVIKPGDAADSRLVEMIVEGKMPKREEKLPQAQIDVITKWVAEGAQNN